MPPTDQNPTNTQPSPAFSGQISVEEVPPVITQPAAPAPGPAVPPSAVDSTFATIPQNSSGGLPPIVPTAPTGGRGGRKIFAAVAGLLLLVGAVGAGIYLVGQNQNPEERADSGCVQTTSIQNGCIINNCTFNISMVKFRGPAPNPGASNGGCLGYNQNPENFTLGPGQRTCVQPACGQCEQLDATSGGQGGTYGYGGPCPTATPGTPRPSATPRPSPSATPLISAQCLNVLVYDENWNLLDATARTQLKVGDVIRVTVAGSASQGALDQARFTFNGTLRTPVTAKKPGSEEFFDEITIPAGATTISIKGELHHPTLDWF